MTELDLTTIRKRSELAAAALSSWATQVMDSACDVADLVAEVERLRRLLGPAKVPSVDAYENVVQALADERAEVVQHCNRIGALESLLNEILDRFPNRPYQDVEVRSYRVREETLDRWRSRLERAT